MVLAALEVLSTSLLKSERNGNHYAQGLFCTPEEELFTCPVLWATCHSADHNTHIPQHPGTPAAGRRRRALPAVGGEEKLAQRPRI